MHSVDTIHIQIIAFVAFYIGTSQFTVVLPSSCSFIFFLLLYKTKQRLSSTGLHHILSRSWLYLNWVFHSETIIFYFSVLGIMAFPVHFTAVLGFQTFPIQHILFRIISDVTISIPSEFFGAHFASLLYYFVYFISFIFVFFIECLSC